MARFIITGEYKDKATKLARRDLKELSRSTIDYGRIAKRYWGIASAAVLYYTQRALKASTNAAVEDEKTQRALAFTITSVAKASEAAAIAAEANIKSMSMTYGIADDELRPAFQSLIRVTGNLTKSSEGLDLALALSAASGADLEQTARAISRAYIGNYRALKSLGFVVDDNLAKQKDTAKILDNLQRQYGDFAKNQLNTTAVQFNRIRVAAGESSEIIGVALIDSMNRFLGTTDGVDKIGQKFEAMGQYIADIITGLTDVIVAIQKLGDYIPDIVKTSATWVQQNLTIFGVLQKQGKQTRINLALQRAQTRQIISARNAEETALRTKKEVTGQVQAVEKKTLEQLMAEEAARKAGFKITEDIDSIQTVAAAKRLAEAREYKFQVLEAAQAQYDSLKKNYEDLNKLWNSQTASWKIFQELVEKGLSIPVALRIAGILPTGSNPPVGAQAPAAVQDPSSLITGSAGPLYGGMQNVYGNPNSSPTINVTVNAGAIGSEEFLVGEIGNAVTKYIRLGNTTAPAGFF